MAQDATQQDYTQPPESDGLGIYDPILLGTFLYKDSALNANAMELAYNTAAMSSSLLISNPLLSNDIASSQPVTKSTFHFTKQATSTPPK
eukprot:9363760-Ditylum_brightwellii.AAC.1